MKTEKVSRADASWVSKSSSNAGNSQGSQTKDKSFSSSPSNQHADLQRFSQNAAKGSQISRLFQLKEKAERGPRGNQFNQLQKSVQSSPQAKYLQTLQTKADQAAKQRSSDLGLPSQPKEGAGMPDRLVAQQKPKVVQRVRFLYDGIRFNPSKKKGKTKEKQRGEKEMVHRVKAIIAHLEGKQETAIKLKRYNFPIEVNSKNAKGVNVKEVIQQHFDNVFLLEWEETVEDFEEKGIENVVKKDVIDTYSSWILDFQERILRYNSIKRSAPYKRVARELADWHRTISDRRNKISGGGGTLGIKNDFLLKLHKDQKRKAPGDLNQAVFDLFENDDIQEGIADYKKQKTAKHLEAATDLIQEGMILKRTLSGNQTSIFAKTNGDMLVKSVRNQTPNQKKRDDVFLKDAYSVIKSYITKLDPKKAAQFIQMRLGFIGLNSTKLTSIADQFRNEDEEAYANLNHFTSIFSVELARERSANDGDQRNYTHVHEFLRRLQENGWNDAFQWGMGDFMKSGGKKAFSEELQNPDD